MPDKAHNQTDARISAMEKRLSEIYKRASEEIEEKADTYFRKFEEKEKKQLEKLKYGEITEQEFKNWRQGQIMMGKHWTAMRDELVEQYKNVSDTALAYINGEMADIYTLNYNAFEDTASGIKGYSFELVDKATVKALATEDRTFLPYKTVNGQKFERWCSKKINAEVLQGILQGESIPKMAKRLQNVTDMNKTSAVRNARTMATSAENKGRMDSYAKAEADGIIMQKKWIATRDNRTRDWHAELDGQLADREEPFVNSMGEIMYPGDPSADPANTYNCRCTLGNKILGFKKVNRDSENGIENGGESDIIDIIKQETFKTFYNGQDIDNFFYFDGEERGLLSKKKSKYSQWLKGLSEDERRYILDYTAAGFGDINDYLRQRKSWEYINEQKVMEKAQFIDSAISKFDLKENIIVQRGVMEDTLDFMISQYGDDSKDWIGKTFHDDGYASTTVLFGNPVATTKPVVFEINVPAGVGRGAYVNELSGYTDTEYEFLLRRGADYTILDIVDDEDTGKLIIKMVMNDG